MRKRMTLLLTVVLCMFVLAGCKCKHQWAEATCDTPKTCSKCGETEGGALGHNWAAATCTDPKTCKTCGLISGEPMDHSWEDATCTAPKTCTACGLTDGDSLDHSWVDATCVAAKNCIVCGETEGEPLEHTWVEANYQQPKTCSECGTVEGDPVPALFEENDAVVENAELGTEYTVTAAEIPFTVVLESYETMEPDETYAAKEGYEWKRLAIRIEAKIPQPEEGQENPLHMSCLDYYDPIGVLESITSLNEEEDGPVVMGFGVNYSGKDYPECLMVLEGTELQIAENPEQENSTMVSTAFFHIPVGYDGLVLCYGDAVQLEETYEGDIQQLYTDENTVFLRLS